MNHHSSFVNWSVARSCLIPASAANFIAQGYLRAQVSAFFDTSSRPHVCHLQTLIALVTTKIKPRPFHTVTYFTPSQMSELTPAKFFFPIFGRTKIFTIQAIHGLIRERICTVISRRYTS